MAFTYVPVVGTYVDSAGLPGRGTVTFTPTAVMRNGSSVSRGAVTYTLDGAGALPAAAKLAATDDPGTIPAGVTYQVVETIVPNAEGSYLASRVSATYPITVPRAATSIDLAVVATDVAPDEPALYQRLAQRGAPGGYAPLDSASLVPLANLPGAALPVSTATQAALDALGVADLADFDGTAAAVGQVVAVSAVSGGEPSGFGLVDVAPGYPDLQITAFGDSLIYADAGTLTTRLGELLGVTVNNQGVSGQSSTDIAIRQGGVRPLLTVTGNQIPASGAVTVTAISPSSTYRKTSGSPSFTWVGTLAGVPGTLTHTLNADTWSFTRTSAGTATACPAGTAFVADSGPVHENRIQVWMVGRNNLLDSGVLLDAARDMRSMRDNLKPLNRQYVALSLLNATTEGTDNAAAYNAILGLNAQLAADHGPHYFDVRRAFIDRGLPLAGISPTTTDLADIARDRPPSSLMQDTVHPNTAGYRVMARLVAEFLAGRDWLNRGTAVPGVEPVRQFVLPTPAAGKWFYHASPGEVRAVTLGTGTFRCSAVIVPEEITIDRIGAEVTVVGDVGSTFRLGIYADNGFGYPGSLLLDAGAILGDSVAVQELTVNATLKPGVYWLGGVTQNATTTQPTIRCVGQNWQPPITINGVNPAASPGQVAWGYSQFSITGALPATFTTSVSPSGAGAPRMTLRRSA